MTKKKKTSSSKTAAKARTLKPKTYKSFRLSKPIKYTGRPLSSSWKLLKKSWSTIWRHKKTLAGVLVIYGLLQVILVQGILANNFTEIKSTVDDVLGGVVGNLAVLSYMLGTIGQAQSAEASVYQTTLFVIGSLAIIWSLRQLLADKQIRIRDAYYKGMYPLIPFVLVLLVIGLQTIPMLIGAWLYSVVVSNGIATALVEQLFWLVIFFIFALLSLYMVCSSIFALYIVTLPDMTPMKALRSARDLVRYRRWSILRKIIILALALLLIVALIMLPIIAFVPAIAAMAFYVLTVLVIGFVHTYIYSLYRELLLDE
jgi:hypothetical protein